MYEKGQGVNQSDKEAIKYYQLAANQGYATAKINLQKIANPLNNEKLDQNRVTESSDS